MSAVTNLRLIPLPLETQARLGGFNTKIVLDATALALLTSGTAQAVLPVNDLAVATVTIPIGTMIGKVAINVETAFTSSGGAITTLTLSLGDGGSSTRFLNAVSLKTAAWTVSSNGLFVYTAADTVDVVATIVGQTMASLNAGALSLYLEKLDAPDLTLVKQP